MRVVAILVALAAGFGAPASAQQFSNGGGLLGIFDEVRFGTVFSVDSHDDSGVIVSGELLFKAFGPPRQNYWANAFLRPRFFIGGNLATGDDPINQVYGGVAWTFPLYKALFLEASFGGTVHDGPLDSPGGGLDLGCHLLFHERLALGIDITPHWRLMASADHSSHAELCHGGNSGITDAGVYAGYRF